ncbi:MAG TPA: leucine/isoleucine/valine transporter permease subunit [Anaerolineae bacterium]|nr:leucine/isoleucine/valine transporter permease subunit [Anaerolineae bacterium]HID84627.1 leucine/isoleucine/valine transporter permease subunit [Anaerolineales bacterium]HIQ09291.1 leucine/isoleucine/valine transporter permease subunit [Anaerolineaceae bacterium]
MREQKTPLQQAVWYGFLTGVIALYVTLVGLVESSSKRAIIAYHSQSLLSLGHVILILTFAGLGYLFAQRLQEEVSGAQVVGLSALVGSMGGAMLGLVPLLGQWIDFRFVFVHASPELYALLRFGQGPWVGFVLLILFAAAMAVVASVVNRLPDLWRRALVNAFLITALVGLLSDLLRRLAIKSLLLPFVEVQGLNPLGAVVTFALVIGLVWWSEKRKALQTAMVQQSPATGKEVLFKRWFPVALGVAGLLYLPYFVGSYLSDVLDMVGLYTLMGLGLNIVVGFAGLLDLGYVAFFAIGAYTTGVLTSTSPLGVAHLPFWIAAVISVLVAMTAGILLGIPVLRMRGDYLAIVTLGFGEIIRILALSDWLKPYIGGAQGILQIPQPSIGSFVFLKPQHFYYLILAGIALAWFVAVRLRDSRLGRAWMAMREDEDVAEAMGINLVNTKLTAFAFGASFSGLSGAIFAAKVGSIFPHSFNLLISINVLSLIIVGGIGSLPGVVVGSLLLVGLPELLREFAEYRLLMYGIALISMMLLKPEGFWPEPVRRRELHETASTD